MMDYSNHNDGEDQAVESQETTFSKDESQQQVSPVPQHTTIRDYCEQQGAEDPQTTPVKDESGELVPTAPQISTNEDYEHLYHGLVDDVPVKRPGYILFVCLFVFLLFVTILYLLGSKDGAYVFADFIHEETEVSMKDKVNDLLEKVARLRAQSSYDSAYVLLRDFHEKHPEESNVNRELGWHNMEKGLFVFASEYYDLAMEVTPSNSRLNYYRGELGLRWGRSEIAKTRTGAMSTETKNAHLMHAISNFEQSKDCFAAALKGFNIYNVDSAKAKALEAEKEWLLARYKRIALLSIKALEEGRQDKSLLKQYYAELTSLLQEESISADLKQQILSRRADLMKEL